MTSASHTAHSIAENFLGIQPFPRTFNLAVPAVNLGARDGLVVLGHTGGTAVPFKRLSGR